MWSRRQDALRVWSMSNRMMLRSCDILSFFPVSVRPDPKGLIDQIDDFTIILAQVSDRPERRSEFKDAQLNIHEPFGQALESLRIRNLLLAHYSSSSSLCFF